MKDELGDLVKTFEKVQTERKILPTESFVARIDGRGFSKFTKTLEKPFDVNFSNIMKEVTRDLVNNFHADFAYTQSDEITLLFKGSVDEKYQHIFNGKIQKIISVISGRASSKFALLSYQKWPELVENKCPHFDCRIFAIPDKNISDVFRWRNVDATRNSIQMLARSVFSHKVLQNLKTREILKYLEGHDVHWDLLNEPFKYGTFFKPVTIEKQLSEEELKNIPVDRRPIGAVNRKVLIEYSGKFKDMENYYE